MFGAQSKTVSGILEEGRSWVERLEAASATTAEEADILFEEAQSVEAKAIATSRIAEEGKSVAANFKQILFPKNS